jgi:hypothetical protein
MRLAALDKLAASDPAVTRYLDLALESQLAHQALNVARSASSVAGREWQPCWSIWLRAPA